MSKKVLSFLLAGLITVSIPMSANAAEKERAEFNSLANEENYVVKRGQINLDELDIDKSFSGKLIVKERDNTSDSKEVLDEFNYLLSLNDGLEEDLANSIGQNDHKMYLGYSTVLLKLDENQNMIPVEKSELTEEELENIYNENLDTNILSGDSRITTVIGDKSNYYQLTLYTLVDTAISDGKRYTVAYADAKWTNNGLYPFESEKIPAEGEDLIAVTLPERYSLLNDYFWGSYGNFYGSTTPTGRLHTVTQNGIVYAFDEIYQYSNYVAHAYTDWVRIGARAVTSDLTPAAETFIGQYVHTFKDIDINPTISIGKGFEWGVDAGISFSDNAWPLSSYVSVEY